MQGKTVNYEVRQKKTEKSKKKVSLATRTQQELLKMSEAEDKSMVKPFREKT